MDRRCERRKEAHSKFYQQGGKSNIVVFAVTDRKIEHVRCTNEIQSLGVFSLYYKRSGASGES